MFRYLIDSSRFEPPIPLVLRLKKFRGIVLRMLRHSKWAEIEEEILHLLVPYGRTSIDVGANAGSLTVPLALLSRDVIAIEPVPSCCETILAAGLPNVAVLQRAMSSVPGTATLTIPTRPGGAPANAMASLEAPEKGEDFMQIDVETGCLDDFADRDVGFVKIDVEGHELEVLKGGVRLVERCRPVFLVEVEERHREGALRDVAAFFAARGYAGYFILGRRTHGIAEFRPDMADPEVLEADLPRKEMRYVNNFIFAPDASAATQQRSKIDRYLSGPGRFLSRGTFRRASSD